jgi:tetratricopeptide (TPR) repeat protein
MSSAPIPPRSPLTCARRERGLRRWDDTRETWRQALPALEAIGDVEGAASLCYDCSYMTGWAHRVAEALELAERGLADIGDRPSPYRARLLAVSAFWLTMSRRFEEALIRIEEARRLAEAQRVDSSLVGEVLLAELFYWYSTIQLARALEPGLQAATALRDAGSSWHLGLVLAFRDAVAVFLGYFRESDEIEAELYPLTERLGNVGAASLARRSEFPKVAAQRADLVTLDALCQAQAEEARIIGGEYLAYATTMRGVVEFWRGDWETTRAHMEEAVALSISPSWFGAYHGFVALVLAHLGRRDEAMAALDEVRHVLPVPGTPNNVGPWTLALLAAEVAGLVPDAETARSVYPLVLEALATGTMMRQCDGVLIHRVAGMSSAAAGHLGKAEEHFEEALHQAEALPHLMERPQVRHQYARFLMHRAGADDRERARLLLDEAIAGYHTIGMPRHESRARELSAVLR